MIGATISQGDFLNGNLTYVEIFSKRAINSLAQHGSYNYTIDLVPDSQPTFGPIYKFPEPALEALQT